MLFFLVVVRKNGARRQVNENRRGSSGCKKYAGRDLASLPWYSFSYNTRRIREDRVQCKGQGGLARLTNEQRQADCGVFWVMLRDPGQARLGFLQVGVGQKQTVDESMSSSMITSHPPQPRHMLACTRKDGGARLEPGRHGYCTRMDTPLTSIANLTIKRNRRSRRADKMGGPVVKRFV
jgi:hypothetical protein